LFCFSGPAFQVLAVILSAAKDPESQNSPRRSVPFQPEFQPSVLLFDHHKNVTSSEAAHSPIASRRTAATPRPKEPTSSSPTPPSHPIALFHFSSDHNLLERVVARSLDYWHLKPSATQTPFDRKADLSILRTREFSLDIVSKYKRVYED
jgi:hypothetical protein